MKLSALALAVAALATGTSAVGLGGNPFSDFAKIRANPHRVPLHARDVDDARNRARSPAVKNNHGFGKDLVRLMNEVNRAGNGRPVFPDAPPMSRRSFRQGVHERRLATRDEDAPDSAVVVPDIAGSDV
ncbi:hypothetical protein RB595_009317 [Gaeumannomyces hyphopodioides]